jgi:hypothetical protein
MYGLVILIIILILLMIFPIKMYRLGLNDVINIYPKTGNKIAIISAIWSSPLTNCREYVQNDINVYNYININKIIKNNKLNVDGHLYVTVLEY